MEFYRNSKGLLLTILVTFILLFLFYGKVICNLNHVYFSIGGDGLQIYANTLYHIAYDTSYMFQKSMNYPFGENVFFTNAQIPLSNTLLFLKDEGLDLSQYSIGLINFLMLVSIPLCIVFLYLILKQLNLPSWYSSLVAIGIGFLSPQIYRFGGHFMLGYLFVIPFVIYLLLLFYKKPKLKYSCILAFFIFYISLFHIYFLGITGALIISYWFWIFLFDRKQRNFKKAILHVSIQIILPLLLLKSWMGYIDGISDRTNNPLGYSFYTAFWEGIFLPLNTPLEAFFSKFIYIETHKFEGIAYVGSAAIIIFWAVGAQSVRRAYNSKNFYEIFKITEVPFLNALFYSSILCLIFAFGFPFKGNYEQYLYYFGWIKQLRAVGRFAWVFFYGINIVAFYLLFKYSCKLHGFSKMTCLSVPLLILFADVYFHNNRLEQNLNNSIHTLEDTNNKIKENEWIGKLNLNTYQAILPLPFFHLGSESIWYESSAELSNEVFLATVKTGLPTLSVHLCRTSLSQTYKSIALSLEPYRRLEIVDNFPDNRPLLVMAREDLIRNTERKLFKKCSFLMKTPKFELYELSIDSLKTIHRGLANEVEGEMGMPTMNGLYTNNPMGSFFHESFDNGHGKGYRGKSSLKIPADKKTIIYEKILDANRSEKFFLSFWFADIDKDLFARTIFKFEILVNNKVVYADESGICSHIQTLDKNWALFEKEVSVPLGYSKMRLTLENYIPGESLCVDELLIRSAGTNVYGKIKDEVLKNNRYYPLSK